MATNINKENSFEMFRHNNYNGKLDMERIRLKIFIVTAIQITYLTYLKDL